MILDFISSIFKPAADIIDNVSTTDEERLTLRNELAKIQSGLSSKYVELQKSALEASSRMAVAESQSDNWFTKTYRPAILTGMFVMIVLNSFGLLTINLPEIFVAAFAAAFGVVGIGRTSEKIVSKVISGKLKDK